MAGEESDGAESIQEEEPKAQANQAKQVLGNEEVLEKQSQQESSAV